MRLKTLYAKWEMCRLADRKGWSSIGTMFFFGKQWSDAMWSRKIRQSNRFYRLAHGKSPWKPYGKF